MRFCSFPWLTALVAAAAVAVSGAPVAAGEAEGHADGSLIRLTKRQCLPNGSFYDDASTSVPITYHGAWTHLKNQGSAVKSGTLSYTGEQDAEVILPNPFAAGTTTVATVTVWSTKKSDRGQFNVYVGQTLLGTGSQYTSGPETSTQRVFYRQNIPIPGGQNFVIKNDKGASYLGFDGLELGFCV